MPSRSELIDALHDKLDINVIKSFFEGEEKLDLNKELGSHVLWDAAIIRTAFSHPNPDVAEYLVDKGLPINLRDQCGNPAFVYAIGYRVPNMDMLHRLISLGLNLDQDEKVAFIYAASCPDLDVLKFFVEKGARIGPNKTGKTILHQAAKGNCNPAILEYIIDELKLDINAETILGDTPLSLAGSRNDHIEITQCLLDKGADPHKVNKYGKLAVDRARPGKKALIRAAMRRSGKNGKNVATFNEDVNSVNIAAISNPKGKSKESLSVPFMDKAWYYSDCDDDLYCTPNNEEYSWAVFRYVKIEIKGMDLCFDICYSDISEELIDQLVDYLDGQSEASAYLWLTKSQDEQLLVYGGNDGWFLCTVYFSVKNVRFVEVVNEANKNGPEVDVNLSGQDDGFSGDSVVQREDAKKIALYYMKHGTPHPDYKWEKPKKR